MKTNLHAETQVTEQVAKKIELMFVVRFCIVLICSLMSGFYAAQSVLALVMGLSCWALIATAIVWITTAIHVKGFYPLPSLKWRTLDSLQVTMYFLSLMCVLFEAYKQGLLN